MFNTRYLKFDTVVDLKQWLWKKKSNRTNVFSSWGEDSFIYDFNLSMIWWFVFFNDLLKLCVQHHAMFFCLLYDFLWLGIRVLLWIHTSLCSFCCFLLQAVRVLYFHLLVLQDVSAITVHCFTWWVLLAFSSCGSLPYNLYLKVCVYSHSSVYLCFPLLNFLSLCLLVDVKDGNSKMYLEEQKTPAGEVLLFWMFFHWLCQLDLVFLSLS